MISWGVELSRDVF